MAKSTDTKDKNDELEAKDSKKRKLPLGLILGFVGCFLLSVGASSGVTYWITSSSSTGEVLAQQQNEVESQLAAMRQSIEQQNATLDAINKESEVLKTYLRHSSATSLKNILINQEENIQGYLAVMRQAIGDLSELLPRSAEWETTYQYQMDIAIKASMERATLLRLLKTGSPPETSASMPAQSTSTNTDTSQ